MRRWVSLAVLAVVLAIAGVAISRAWLRARAYARAEAVCAAVDRHDWTAALAGSAPLVDATVPGTRVADCRCTALLATGQGGECFATLDRLLADPAIGDWLPRPTVLAALVDARQQRGDLQAALQLAQRGVDRDPRDLELLRLEATLRSQLETPEEALAAVQRRVAAAGEGAEDLRQLAAVLAAAQLVGAQRGEEALAALGERPPGSELAEQWWRLRLMALAQLGRTAEMAATVDAWQRATGSGATARALYAYSLSINQLDDPAGRPVVDLLQDAVEHGDELHDDRLLGLVYQRFVGTLSVLGRGDEALAWYDRGVARLGHVGQLERDDLARSAVLRLGGSDALVAAGRRVRLRVGAARPGDVLWLSPPDDAPVDATYERQPVPADGTVVVERAPAAWPQRWVLVDAAGAVAGSGTFWLGSGDTTVAVERRAARPALPAYDLAPRPPAGRPRLFVVILDCGDWRYLAYGRARRELPFFDALVGGGRSAVLWSDPPFTALAVRSLVYPEDRGVDGVFGLFYELGSEIEGLNFVGRNPAAPLASVIAGGTSLFETLGAGELRTVNMLHSHGKLQVGRHGEVIGPHGVHRMVEGFGASRPLRPEELALFGGRVLRNEDLLREMAADFDTVSRLGDDPTVDLAVLRVASLDLLTHGNFPETARAGQDDGAPLLYGTYRYVDRRLGELWRRLDGNDALVVMSDHGIHTALEHDPRAVFVALGARVPAGRDDGQPVLRGVGRAVADFFGVETGWPSSGLVDWAPAPVTPAAPATR